MCTPKDFEDRGIKLDQFKEAEILKRLCPDMNSKVLQKYEMVRNAYTNRRSRTRFAIMVNLCEKESKCKSQSQIRMLLKELQWTMYAVNGQVKFKKEESSSTPFETIDLFHSQFQLNADQYRD